MRLKDKVAIVTGASRGIGAEIASMFAAEGARVVLAARSMEEMEQLRQSISRQGGESICVSTDVRSRESMKNMVKTACDAYGAIDILVNNAGYFYDVAPLVEMSDDQVNNTIDINLKGTMYMSREVCRRLVDAGTPGRVINITSGAAHSGRVNFSNYCASKAGILGLTRAMALELAPAHINVNSVSVGYVEVGRWEGDPSKDAVRANIIPRILLRRPGAPRDISRMVCFLASECGDWITGSDFIIDGGESCGRVPFAD